MIELKNADKFKFQAEPHIHSMLINGQWQTVPGVTSVSALYQLDFWKFAWPVKLMEEKILEEIKVAAFDRETHGGFLGGKDVQLEDVERITKKAKNAWREKRDKSADAGTLAHGAIEEWIKYEMTKGQKRKDGTYLWWHTVSSLDSEQDNILQNFQTWVKRTNPLFFASELQVGSLTHSYCGILDAICEINGKKVLLDFKTSATGDKPEYAIQLAGLAMALEEMGYKVDERAILWLPKKGNYKYIPITSDLEWDKKAFLAGLKFLSYKNQVLGGEK